MDHWKLGRMKGKGLMKGGTIRLRSELRWVNVLEILEAMKNNY